MPSPTAPGSVKYCLQALARGLTGAAKFSAHFPKLSALASGKR
jgi:hypothetical protein